MKQKKSLMQLKPRETVVKCTKTKNRDIVQLFACKKMVDKQTKNDKQPNNSDIQKGREQSAFSNFFVNKKQVVDGKQEQAVSSQDKRLHTMAGTTRVHYCCVLQNTTAVVHLLLC